MRLIDADALAMHLADWQLSSDEEERDVIEEAIRAIDNAPTVDAVPVVRCKDCKHWQPSEYGVVEQPYCKYLGYIEETGLDICIGNENDFCSFGERKDDD